jgi:hypothetical protein
MKVKVPYSLLEKFLNYEGLIVENEPLEVPGIGGIRNYIPGEAHYRFEIDITEEPRHYECVSQWDYLIKTYFKSSYTAYRIDIGPCKGVWPIGIEERDNRLIAHFRTDYVDAHDRSWKDWFIREDIIIAPK